MRNIDYKLLFKIIIGMAIAFGIAFLLDTYIWQGMEESTKGLSETIQWIGIWILVILISFRAVRDTGSSSTKAVAFPLLVIIIIAYNLLF